MSIKNKKIKLKNRFKLRLRFIKSLFVNFYNKNFYFLKKLVVKHLLYSLMYLNSIKNLNKFYLNYFYLLTSRTVALNIVATLYIFRKLLLFISNILEKGGYFLICNFEEKSFFFDYITFFKFMFTILNQGLILGMPFNGLLTNKNIILTKLRNTKHSVSFNELYKLSPELRTKVLYCERMVFNQFFKKNYFDNYNLPSCIILLNLHSFIYYEAVILKLPIVGVINTASIFNTVTYPLFFNNENLLSLFLFFNLLNKLFFYSLYLELLALKVNLQTSLKTKSILSWVFTRKKFLKRFYHFYFNKKKINRRFTHTKLSLYNTFNKKVIMLNKSVFTLRHSLLIKLSAKIKKYKKYQLGIDFYNFYFYNEIFYYLLSKYNRISNPMALIRVIFRRTIFFKFYYYMGKNLFFGFYINPYNRSKLYRRLKYEGFVKRIPLMSDFSFFSAPHTIRRSKRALKEKVTISYLYA